MRRAGKIIPLGDPVTAEPLLIDLRATATFSSLSTLRRFILLTLKNWPLFESEINKKATSSIRCERETRGKRAKSKIVSIVEACLSWPTETKNHALVNGSMKPFQFVKNVPRTWCVEGNGGELFSAFRFTCWNANRRRVKINHRNNGVNERESDGSCSPPNVDKSRWISLIFHASRAYSC